jgi:hypothetical protein
MHSVRKIPEGLELPDMSQLISGRPTTWLRNSLEWINSSEPNPVFIERFQICKKSIRSEILLWGARYEVADILVNGEKLYGGRGNFTEFFAIEMLATGWKVHRLLQRKSTMLSDLDDDNDFLAAGEIKASEFLLDKVPSWKKSEAYWPTHKETPMLFVGQVTLPETEITRTLLTWDDKVFLFWLPEGENSRFKIFTQPAKFQSAEDHYREEAERETRKRWF